MVSMYFVNIVVLDNFVVLDKIVVDVVIRVVDFVVTYPTSIVIIVDLVNIHVLCNTAADPDSVGSGLFGSPRYGSFVHNKKPNVVILIFFQYKMQSHINYYLILNSVWH